MPTQKPTSSRTVSQPKGENVPDRKGLGLKGFSSRLSSRKFSKREALTAAAGLIVIAALVIVFVSAAGLRKNIKLIFGGTSGNVSTNSDGSLAFNATTTSPNAATGKFYVVGKYIVDPEGNVFLPMGANVGIRQAPNLENNYIFNYFGTANDKSPQVKAWGWNIIRPNINCNPGSNPSYAQTMAGLDQLIKEYSAQKIVVMVTCRVDVSHDHPYTDAEIQASLPMIKDIARTYKGYPYVWMNPYNEPVVNQSVWSPLNQSLYNDVRALAPDMMYVADLAGSGNQIETLVDGNLATTFGTGKCNVLYDWHAYGFINGFANDATHSDYIKRLAAKNIAMIVGEFGDPLLQDGSPFIKRTSPGTDGIAGDPIQNRIAANAVIKYAPPAGYGLVWWIATGDRNDQITYSLTKDMTSPWTVTAANAATKLSPAGKAFWDASHQNHNLGKFPGNIRESGCASAQ